MGALPEQASRPASSRYVLENHSRHPHPGATKAAKDDHRTRQTACCAAQRVTVWLRPTLQEIVDAHGRLYGKESRLSDNETSGTEGSEEETEDENGEENAESDEEQAA